MSEAHDIKTRSVSEAHDIKTRSGSEAHRQEASARHTNSHATRSVSEGKRLLTSFLAYASGYYSLGTRETRNFKKRQRGSRRLAGVFLADASGYDIQLIHNLVIHTIIRRERQL